MPPVAAPQPPHQGTFEVPRAEPAPLAWLPRAEPGDWFLIFDGLDLNTAIGRGRFVCIEVLGIRQSIPFFVILDQITWLEEEDVLLERMPSLEGAPLAGPLYFQVGTSMMRPEKGTGRWAVRWVVSY
jgi:hypothetical protein